MKRLAIAITAIALIGTPAFAADMALKAAPAPVNSWTGWYVGLNAGYTWNHNTIETTAIDQCAILGVCNYGVTRLSTALTAGSFYNILASQRGFIGGGQAGYNYQIGNTYVAGLEADIQGIGAQRARGSVLNSVLFGQSFQNVSATSNLRTDYLGTVRGRFGILANPTLLAYVTGGLAYARVGAQTQESAITSNGSTLAVASGNISTTRTGYTVGGGAEMMLAPNWTLKAEYLFYDLGRITYSFGPLVQFVGGQTASATLATSSVHIDGNIVRVGLNYQFH